MSLLCILLQVSYRELLDVFWGRVQGLPYMRCVLGQGLEFTLHFKTLTRNPTAMLLPALLQVSYRELLDVFWGKHDPTSLNKQGADVGTQYRAGIYTHSTEQAEQAAK
jgi:peptide methionine sulfoxide reductase MsrA